jgi:hypothetical protein
MSRDRRLRTEPAREPAPSAPASERGERWKREHEPQRAPGRAWAPERPDGPSSATRSRRWRPGGQTRIGGAAGGSAPRLRARSWPLRGCSRWVPGFLLRAIHELGRLDVNDSAARARTQSPPVFRPGLGERGWDHAPQAGGYGDHDRLAPEQPTGPLQGARLGRRAHGDQLRAGQRAGPRAPGDEPARRAQLRRRVFRGRRRSWDSPQVRRDRSAVG